MADIRVIFVLPENANDESDASEMMAQAYDSCKQLVNNISWVKESNLSTIKFTKLDYVVFENFEGKDFTKYIESKCAVVGPLAISVCLMEGKPIPSFQWPILNVAMYGCEVTCSQLSKTEKEAIRDKVHLMGGFYTGNLTDSITHLICNGTKSEKYMLAAEKGVKLMLPSWINHLFEKSQLNNVSANDPNIIDKFKCPALYNLIICTTGITSNKERMRLSEQVSKNGGTMVAKLALSKTDVLVCYGPGGTTSDKYKAARKTSHILCVTIDWIYDSIEKGYALPHENYRVKTITSTPTRECENIDPNFSTISAITGSVHLRTHIDDTVNATNMTSNEGPVSEVKKVNNKRKADDDLVEKIDIKKVKNAGNFLDGCSVFVAGFRPEQRDKLNKIINISGATRYDDFSERVSHVIIGDPSCSEVTTLKAKGVQCCLVTVQWLLDSMDQQKPADEHKYSVINVGSLDIDKTQTNSPLSKRAINFLQGPNFTNDNTTITKDNRIGLENDDPLTQKYLTSDKEEEDTLAKLLGNQNTETLVKPNKTDEFNIKTRPFTTRKNDLQNSNQTIDFKPQDTSTQISQVTTDLSESDIDILPIFCNCKFILEGFDEEETETFKTHIIAVGGSVVDKRFKGICDYAVCPMINKPVNLPPVREIVNELWLTECISSRALCTEIKYYHRPIELQSTRALLDCVISISGYSGDERDFLQATIEGLGGTFQELFSRKVNQVRNVLASTHLVSSEAAGKKYQAALKWKIPVLNKDWLLECVKTGTKVRLEDFLIGESKSPESSHSNSDITDNSDKNEKNMKNSNNSSPELKNTSHANLNEQNKVDTPKSVRTLENNQTTPVNQIYNFNPKNTPDACSQVTPINKILQDAINNKVLPTPPSPKTYYPWDPKTPDTPLGAFIRPNPSPRLRKEMQKYVNSFPEFVPPKRRLSTPLSELKRRLMDKVLGRGEFSQTAQVDLDNNSQISQQQELELNELQDSHSSNQQPNIENLAVHQKLQELQQRVMASGSSSATRRSSRAFEASSNLPGIEKRNIEIQSQVCTVGWDYGEEKSQNVQQKIFMLSGVEVTQREELANSLQSLGALVSDSPNYDASSTHLICPKPGRNEKSLACMAAGKWILHVSYVEKSIAAGHFLSEEEFEFGNPKARSNIFFEEKDSSICFWRKEIGRRGYGAFNDMRAIVIAEKKEPIAKVIEAGGGVVLNISPPFDESIHATHCLLEIKMVKDFSEFIMLAQQGIKCVSTIYINDYLWRSKKDDDDYIPYFSKYYK